MFGVRDSSVSCRCRVNPQLQQLTIKIRCHGRAVLNEQGMVGLIVNIYGISCLFTQLRSCHHGLTVQN